jgi:hypothetical protein
MHNKGLLATLLPHMSLERESLGGMGVVYD